MSLKDESISYAELQKKIKELQDQAEQVRKREVEAVIQDIKEKIALYHIDAKDLGFFEKNAQEKKKPASQSAKTKNATIKYRDEDGNAWSGRGARPHWLKEKLDNGRKLEEFEI